jgi:hypothetical protein
VRPLDQTRVPHGSRTTDIPRSERNRSLPTAKGKRATAGRPYKAFTFLAARTTSNLPYRSNSHGVRLRPGKLFVGSHLRLSEWEFSERRSSPARRGILQKSFPPGYLLSEGLIAYHTIIHCPKGLSPAHFLLAPALPARPIPRPGRRRLPRLYPRSVLRIAGVK